MIVESLLALSSGHLLSTRHPLTVESHFNGERKRKSSDNSPPSYQVRMMWKHLLDSLIPHVLVWQPTLYSTLNKTFYCLQGCDFFCICGLEMRCCLCSLALCQKSPSFPPSSETSVDSPTGLRFLSWTFIAEMSVFPALTVSPKPPPPRGCFIHVPSPLLLVASFVPGCENRLLIVSCCLWDRNTS